MKFFSEFGTTVYNIDNNLKQKIVTDIFKSIRVMYTPAENITLFYNYTVVDGEKPEHLAYKFYDNAEYHWIILLMNDIIHPFFDWVLTNAELYSYAKSKYDNINDIHHFKDLQTNETVDQYDFVRYYDDWENDIALPHYISPITNIEYERELNDAKRNVKILRQEYVNDFVVQFEKLMAGKV